MRLITLLRIMSLYQAIRVIDITDNDDFDFDGIVSDFLSDIECKGTFYKYKYYWVAFVTNYNEDDCISIMITKNQAAWRK